MKKTLVLFSLLLLSINSSYGCFWGPCKGEVKVTYNDYDKDFPDFKYSNSSIEGHIHELELISQKNGDVINLMPYGHLFYYQTGYQYVYERESLFNDKGCLFDLKGWGRTDRGDYDKYDYLVKNIDLCRLKEIHLY